MGQVDDQNPADYSGSTPLHLAAREGLEDICRLIMGRVENKNPANHAGWTPLHLAVTHGHSNVCRLIADSVDDPNPALHLDGLPWFWLRDLVTKKLATFSGVNSPSDHT